MGRKSVREEMAHVVCLGVHIVDILGRPVEGIPQGQSSYFLEEIRMTVAGTAAGTAVDLAKLGADVVTMGAIGNDDLGDYMRAKMTGFGVNTSRLVRKPGVQTSASILPIRPNGERPALHVVGANAAFGLEDVDWDAIAAAEFLHFGGLLRLPRLEGQPAADILRFAQAHGVVTTADVLGVRHPRCLEALRAALPHIDYFMPNLAEGQHISGLSEPVHIADFFVDAGVACVVLKMGAEGSLIKSRSQEVWLPALQVPVVDSTGCGDAYCAGFIVGLSLGWGATRAGQLGTVAAALVLGGLGSDAGIVDLAHTLAVMEDTSLIAEQRTGAEGRSATRE
jgi:sugar/nucleoside kinase (ribokinase family)